MCDVTVAWRIYGEARELRPTPETLFMYFAIFFNNSIRVII